MARFRVENWAACCVNGSNGVEWLTRETDRASTTMLPSILRRRVSAIGQKAFETALHLGDITGARFIFCSRHGEYRRTQSLLESIAKNEPTSPADFSLSVHNALAGLLSIAHANGAGHTTIAAGVDSFGFGLLEAAACLDAREDERVLLVYFDEPLPEDYVTFCEEQEAFAAALLLSLASGADDDVLLELTAIDERLPRRSATEQASDFIDFLRSERGELASRGARAQWRWRRAHA